MSVPQKFKKRKGYLSFISNYTEEIVPLANVKYIMANDKLCEVHIHNLEPFTTYLPLRKLEEQLPADNFVKINRACIVAMDEVSVIENGSVYLFDGTELPISRARIQMVQDIHRKYINRYNEEKQEVDGEIEKYHLLDISPVPRCVFELIFDDDKPVDLKFRYANEAFERLIDKENFIGMTYRELFSHMDESWMDFYAPTALSGIPKNVVAYSNEIKRTLYVRTYQLSYGYCVCLMQDIKVIQDAIRESLHEGTYKKTT